MSLPVGWYPVAGDPPGTRRYWDGSSFVGDPERDASEGRRAGFARTGSATSWRRAGVVSRAIAAIVDYGAPLVIVVGIAMSWGVESPGFDLQRWIDSRALLAAVVATIVVNQVVLVGFFGRSLGRILLGLRVVDARDRNRSPGIVRALLRFLVLLPGLPISALMLFFGGRRTLHDVAATTAVIYV